MLQQAEIRLWEVLQAMTIFMLLYTDAYPAPSQTLNCVLLNSVQE